MHAKALGASAISSNLFTMIVRVVSNANITILVAWRCESMGFGLKEFS